MQKKGDRSHDLALLCWGRVGHLDKDKSHHEMVLVLAKGKVNEHRRKKHAPLTYCWSETWWYCKWNISLIKTTDKFKWTRWNVEIASWANMDILKGENKKRCYIFQTLAWWWYFVPGIKPRVISLLKCVLYHELSLQTLHNSLLRSQVLTAFRTAIIIFINYLRCHLWPP